MSCSVCGLMSKPGQVLREGCSCIMLLVGLASASLYEHIGLEGGWRPAQQHDAATPAVSASTGVQTHAAQDKGPLRVGEVWLLSCAVLCLPTCFTICVMHHTILKSCSCSTAAAGTQMKMHRASTAMRHVLR